MSIDTDTPLPRSKLIWLLVAVEVLVDVVDSQPGVTLCDLSWRAWRTVDCIDSTVRVMAVMPLSAALQRLDAVRHGVEQVAQVAGAGLQRDRGEEVGRIVEGGVDLLAGGKTVLGGAHQVGGLLQGQQVLPDTGRESDVRAMAATLLVDAPYGLAAYWP